MLSVLHTPRDARVGNAEAPAAGRSILDTARWSKGAAAYREVTERILEAV